MVDETRMLHEMKELHLEVKDEEILENAKVAQLSSSHQDQLFEGGQKACFQAVTLPAIADTASGPTDALYNRAFLIPQKDDSMDDCILSVASMECVTVVLLYNLALALHREALQSSHDPAHATLDRVLYMYRQAHSILEKINLVDFPEVVSVLGGAVF